MSLSDSTYLQPEKNDVRSRVIAGAVTALTSDRYSSPVVTTEVFHKTMEYGRRHLGHHEARLIREEVQPHIDGWLELHRSRVGVKKPSDLQVLFLAGPDPTNDLMTLRKHGIAFENIWAIESDKRTFMKAVSATGQHGIRVKLHRGGLHSFFTIVPQQFDIVYFDATAPLFGGEPNTIEVVRELFLNQRLSPLAVLITNFAETMKDANPEAWAQRIGNWAYANGTEETFTEEFPEFVRSKVKPRIQEYYSEFITKFLIRFAGQLVPWWRVAALPGARKEYFSDEKILAEAALRTNTVEMLTNPLYPLLRLVLFTSLHLDANDVMSKLLFKDTLEKAKLADAVKIASLIRTFYEIKFDGVFGSTKHVLDACSPTLAEVLKNFEWFDERGRVFCDVPFPNLITDLLLGLYGFPYHVNAQKIQRYAYKAKETVMFTDILVFDQARYVYDLLPTLSLFDTDFSLPQQLVLRVCMDAMHRHCHYGCKDLFWGCALAGLGEEGFTYWLPPARESIGNPGVSFMEPDADGSEVWDEFLP